jgi:hypothetical protein
MYLAKDPVQGVQTLMNPALRKVLTGGVVTRCGVVSFENNQATGYGAAATQATQK